MFKDFLFHPWCLMPAPSHALIISLLRGSQFNPVYQFQSQPLARNTIRSLFSAQNLMGPESTWLKSLTYSKRSHGKQEREDHYCDRAGRCSLTSNDWLARYWTAADMCLSKIISNWVQSSSSARSRPDRIHLLSWRHLWSPKISDSIFISPEHYDEKWPPQY